MEVGRRYWVALAVVVLAAGGYVGVTQVKAAEDRADARTQAAEHAKYLAEAKVFHAEATALVARLPHSAAFTAADSTQLSPCTSGLNGILVCLDTAKRPGPAVDAFLDSARPLGLVIQKKKECFVPPMLSARAKARFGNSPRCVALGTLGGLTFSVTSVQLLDRVHSTQDHPVWSGSRVSLYLSF